MYLNTPLGCFWTDFNAEWPKTLELRGNIEIDPVEIIYRLCQLRNIWQHVTITTTTWLKLRLSGWQEVWRKTSDASAAATSPSPPPPSTTHPPTSSVHKTNTYESQQERLHNSACSSIQIMLLFLFWEPLWRFCLSLVRVSCWKPDCFVMESKLDPLVKLWIALRSGPASYCGEPVAAVQERFVSSTCKTHWNFYQKKEGTLSAGCFSADKILFYVPKKAAAG